MTLITVTARRELTGYMANTATYRDLEGSESAQSTLISDKDIALTTAVVTPGGHPTAPCTWCWLFCCLLFAYCIRVHHGYTPNKQRERETLSILMNQAMVRSGCQDLDDIYLNTCEDIKRVHKQGDSCLLFRFSRLKHLIDDIFQVQNNEDISLVIKTTMSNSPI